jgi:phage shock protein C
MTNSPERPYRRLTLSVTDKKIAGVCGGIAEYFGIDANLVRLITVVLALLGGSGLLIYVVAWIIMPKP